jgi:CheY-like chemotaxis protein
MSKRKPSRDELLAEVERLRARLEKAPRDLREAESRAEASARAKSDFFAKVSHEIRTPMTAIIGYTDLLIEEGNLTAAPRSRLDYLRTIKRNGQHLLRILNDILDLSRIEAGRIEIERIDVSIREIVDDVAAVARRAAAEKGIRFESRYEGLLPAEIRTDPTRLRQILMNLLANAVKFTDRGEVRLATRLVDADSPEPQLQFRVSDTGPGLPPEAHETIFEAFARVGGPASRRSAGTGLGLAIAHQLSKLLGARIEVESREGRGSVFTLSLRQEPLSLDLLVEPGTDMPEAEDALEDESTRTFLEEIRRSNPGARILLVEDAEDNRRLVAFMLEKVGFQVVQVENGDQAVERAVVARDGETPFDVILMDMQLPLLDGYEVTRKLRQADYDGPILALTAHTLQEEPGRCLAAGCDDVATKPIDRRDLIEKIVALLHES